MGSYYVLVSYYSLYDCGIFNIFLKMTLLIIIIVSVAIILIIGLEYIKRKQDHYP